MGALTWLAYTIILSPNRALLIASSSDPIFISFNEICYILAQLVSGDRPVVGMGIFLAVFLPDGVDSDFASDNMLSR